MISVSRNDFRMEELADQCPDWSYLEQDEFADRLKEFQRDEFYFVGVRAAVEINIPHGPDTFITQRITTPGLWGIESDSGKAYLHEVFTEESEVLASMLSELGIEVTD
jgi:hypothetical protein